MIFQSRTLATLGWLCFLGCHGAPLSVGDNPGEVTDVVNLRCKELTESSGLLFSMRDPNCVWSHNDSGDGPNLFCFDRRDGSQTGSCSLIGITATDWEDMAGGWMGPDEKTPHLIVADTGNNFSRRSSVLVHVFEEPDPHSKTTLNIDEVVTASIQYPDGPKDCEALWFDWQRQRVVMVSKSKLPLVGVYAVPISKIMRPQTDLAIIADRLRTLPLPMATSADCDLNTGDVWITSYWQAWKFPGGEDDPLQRMPIAFNLPAWKQIEAVAVDDKGGVWMTSEGSDATLGRLKVAITKETTEGQPR